jgi:hypothetical protein
VTTKHFVPGWLSLGWQIDRYIHRSLRKTAPANEFSRGDPDPGCLAPAMDRDVQGVGRES